jgi:hypothetical protein
MNIFVLDKDPKLCAEYHNNKHVVKMILETAQLLCGVHHMTESDLDIPYRLSHKNHPCSIWARECIENYYWLCELGLELGDQYSIRYDGKKHKSVDVVEWCLMNPPSLCEKGSITDFALAMPDECKVGDVVESYRTYYMTEKREIADWKKVDKPHWYH